MFEIIKMKPWKIISIIALALLGIGILSGVFSISSKSKKNKRIANIFTIINFSLGLILGLTSYFMRMKEGFSAAAQTQELSFTYSQ